MTNDPLKPATKAALALALLLLLQLHAPAAAAASNTPATSKGKHNNNKKGGGGGSSSSSLSGLAAREKATGVPGCSACVLASSGHKSAKKYTCTLCEGEAYDAKPLKGVCSCTTGFGRASSAPAPAHSGGKSSKKGGSSKSNNSNPLAACTPCPENTVSGPYSDSCVACGPGLQPYGRASCVAACSPFASCSAAGASCGSVEDGCGGKLECGSCPGAQVCDPSSRSCICPDGSSPVGGFCALAGARLACFSDGDCASGLCSSDDGVCLDTCPENSESAASALNTGSGCVCSADSFSINGNGKPPCAPCGGGSSAATPGSNACTCLPPREWSATLNECVCTTPGTAFVNGDCRKVGVSGGTTDPASSCSFDDECVSGVCSGGVCSLRSCPDGTLASGDTGKCLCGPGTWSPNNGEAPGCLPCGAGASSASYGSTSCTCTTPVGSVWSPASTKGGCRCPDGYIAATTPLAPIPTCLLKNGETCAKSAECASGICDVAVGKCIAKCPPNSALDASSGNRCRCNVDFYNAATGGFAPCAPCLGDATTNGLTKQSSCSCPAGKGTFSVTTGGCVCGPGEQKQPATGRCLSSDLRLCERDDQCAGGVCDPAVGICLEAAVDVCPINSEPVTGGGCRCLAGFFDDGAGGCVRCGPESFAPLPGASSCQCSSPLGSVWVRSSNSCRCLDGETDVNGECLVANGGSCSAGEDCASGLCSQNVCVASCPAGSQPEGGSCVCSPGFYGPTNGGEAPCVACGGGSKSLGTGNTVCRCSPALGEVWNAEINRCECPLNQEFAAGRCRGVDGQTCRSRDDCASGACLKKICSSPCTPPTVFSSGSGGCECPRGTFGASCTACPPGATTEGLGASACLCETPLGSAWTGATTNTCACPPNQVATSDGVCKLAPGEACASGKSCSTGLCDQGVCVASCPSPSSEPDGVGGCRCAAGFFGNQGRTPCAPCGTGATSTAGSATCTCPSPATWSAGAGGGSCSCPSGFNWSGSACTCLATTCSPLCPGAASPSCPQGYACDRGECLPDVGSKCTSTDNRCGLCVKSCGNTLATVCSAYNLPTGNKDCQISAVGGGGRCAGTSVCCSIVYPYVILPSPVDGSCSPRSS